MRYERHIFVCVNEREEGHHRGCCKAKGGEEVRAALKERIKSLGLKARCRANAAGCLDACEFGVTAVVYPDGVWYGGVTIDDVEEIVDRHLIKGEPVDRLRIPHRKYTPEEFLPPDSDEEQASEESNNQTENENRKEK